MQEEDDWALKSHFEDAVEEEIVEAAQDTDSLQFMVGLKEGSVHYLFIDPVVEYMEALIISNSPTLILCQG